MTATLSVSEVLATVSRRLRRPAGHTEIPLDAFERLIWPNYEAELPVGPGWATTCVGGTRFAAWVPESGAKR